MSCEDEDTFKRLLASGARGWYRPELIVYHHLPPERLTKRYFRRWCFWRGVSLGILDRQQPQECVTCWAFRGTLRPGRARGSTNRGRYRQRRPPGGPVRMRARVVGSHGIHLGQTPDGVVTASPAHRLIGRTRRASSPNRQPILNSGTEFAWVWLRTSLTHETRTLLVDRGGDYRGHIGFRAQSSPGADAGTPVRHATGRLPRPASDPHRK